MVINSESAHEFIRSYKTFLLFCRARRYSEGQERFLKMLLQGREVFLDDRDLLKQFRGKHENMPPWLYEAIASIELCNWIYLRDTSKYSLFIKEDFSAAYAVKGLTDPLKKILGSSGIYLKAALFRFEDQFVCDGLITNTVKLGKNMKEDFNERLKEMKANGLFFRHAIAYRSGRS